MPRLNNPNRKAGLALAMAAGRTFQEWADASGVPERTACTWSRSPEVVEQVEQLRREVVERAVGRLCENATTAVNEIAHLIREARSESVRLQAARAILAELMAVSSFAALNGRMAELERRVREGSPWPGPGSRPEPPARPIRQRTDGPSREGGAPCEA